MANNQPPVYWTFVLCQWKPGISCTPISVISTVSTSKQLRYPLDRPAMLTGKVPSENPHVNILYGDGYPYLHVGNRIIKGYRRPATDSVSQLKYAGVVWTLEDSADGNTSQTSFTCYDPFQMLTKRLIRDSYGDYPSLDVIFGSVNADQIAKQIVDATNTYVGPTGINTALGTFTTAPAQSWDWQQQYVATGLVDMCDTGALDVWFDPTDGLADGDFVVMNAAPMRGISRPGVHLSYAAPGHTAFSMDRTVSLDTVANSIGLWAGSANPSSPFVDNSYASVPTQAAATASQGVIGVYEDASVITDVYDPTAIANLLEEQLAMRLAPRDLLTMLPAPEKAALPFSEYFVGDLVNIYASLGYDQTFPATRQRLNGVQRIYGLTLDIDDNGVERVSGVDVSPQTGSA